LRLVEPRNDEWDFDRLRLASDDRGHAPAIRTFHGPLEHDLVLASDLPAEHAVGSLRPAHFALEDEGAWRGHRPVERRDGEKDLRRLEPSMPSAVADDAPEPTSQGAGASRTSSRSDERFDPGLPRLRQNGPLGLRQDPLQFGSRGEIRMSPRRFRKMCVSDACTNSNVIQDHDAGGDPGAASSPSSKVTGESRTNPNADDDTWRAKTPRMATAYMRERGAFRTKPYAVARTITAIAATDTGCTAPSSPV